VKVIGKHRELLIDLLIYYLNKDNHNHINFANFIDAETDHGKYWITAYIDDYKDRAIPWDPNTNNNAGY
jgi:hypothetical protein